MKTLDIDFKTFLVDYTAWLRKRITSFPKKGNPGGGVLGGPGY